VVSTVGWVGCVVAGGGVSAGTSGSPRMMTGSPFVWGFNACIHAEGSTLTGSTVWGSVTIGVTFTGTSAGTLGSPPMIFTGSVACLATAWVISSIPSDSISSSAAMRGRSSRSSCRCMSWVSFGGTSLPGAVGLVWWGRMRL